MKTTWGRSLDARAAKDRECNVREEESGFQRFQWDKTISRPRHNIAEHMPGGFLAEVGGDKTVGWVLRRKLGRLREILLDFRSEGK